VVTQKANAQQNVCAIAGRSLNLLFSFQITFCVVGQCCLSKTSNDTYINVVHHLDMKNENYHIYKYRFGTRQFILLIICFVPIGTSILLLTRSSNVDNTVIALVCFLTVIGLTQILLTTNYITKSLNTEIRIDHEKGVFEIVRKGTKKIFNLDEIVSLDIHEQSSIGLFGLDFEYAKYTFADGKQFIVTTMMTDSYYIPAGLNPQIKSTIFPIILERTIV
jgi:hypothetical protein